MKNLIAGALAILVAVSLTACSSDEEEAPTSPQDNNFDRLHEHQYVLNNGNNVTCITYKSGYAGGVSCDWRDR